MVPAAGLALTALLYGVAGAARPAFVLQDSRIGESSGLAASSYNAALVLTHNDSGNAADYFVVDTRTGRTVERVPVTGATNVDWEDIAVSGHTVFLADIGDNRANRASVVIYDVPEARAGAPAEAAHATKLTYEDGPRDAEAILVPPGGKPRFIVTKQLFGARVYEIAGDHLGHVADLQAGLVTGGSWSPDGRRIALLSYVQILVYDAATFPHGDPQVLPLPKLRQAESITWSGNDALLVGSEGVHSPVFRIPVPAGVSAQAPGTTAPARATPTPEPREADAAKPGLGAKPQAGLARRTSAAAIVVVLALITIAVARIRRRRDGGLG